MPEAMSLLVNLASSFSRSLSSLSSSSNSKCSPTPRSSFDFDGTVGLGIVAAMTAAGGGASPPPPPPPRSEPLPSLSVSAATADKMMTRTKQQQQRVISIPNWQQQEEEDDIDEEDEESWSSMEIDESSENYTCVTSYVGGQPVSKTAYIDDGSIQIISPPISLSNLESIKSKVVLFIGSPLSSPESSPLPPRLGKDFLSSCHFCKRSLQGLDIFMYRGEIPFCSQECRYQHVLNDKHQDSCLLKALKLFDEAPPPVLSAGITAAPQI